MIARAFAPASVANVAVGFDILGHAIAGVGDTVIVRRIDEPVVRIEAIRGKGEWWTSNHEVHGMIVAGPWPHDDRFIVGFKIDATFKTSGERFTMEEMALYTVEDGKIVREEFFYAA